MSERGPEKGLWHYAVIGLSAALLLAVLSLAVVVIVIPKLSGATPLTVLTSSMEPTLPPGTLIVVQPIDVAELAVGDVATYQIRSGEPEVITHRIIAISEATTGARTFEFQGDNNSDPDPDPILAEQIQGRVTYSVPLVGWANVAVNGENRTWIIPVLAVGLFSYAGYMLVGGIVSAVRAKRSSPTES